jgi:hypothetical protein
MEKARGWEREKDTETDTKGASWRGLNSIYIIEHALLQPRTHSCDGKINPFTKGELPWPNHFLKVLPLRMAALRTKCPTHELWGTQSHHGRSSLGPTFLCSIFLQQALCIIRSPCQTCFPMRLSGDIRKGSHVWKLMWEGEQSTFHGFPWILCKDVTTGNPNKVWHHTVMWFCFVLFLQGSWCEQWEMLEMSRMLCLSIQAVLLGSSPPGKEEVNPTFLKSWGSLWASVGQRILKDLWSPIHGSCLLGTICRPPRGQCSNIPVTIPTKGLPDCVPQEHSIPLTSCVTPECSGVLVPRTLESTPPSSS